MALVNLVESLLLENSQDDNSSTMEQQVITHGELSSLLPVGLKVTAHSMLVGSACLADIYDSGTYFFCGGLQGHVFFVLRSSHRGWESLGVNFPSWLAIPRKRSQLCSVGRLLECLDC